MCVSERGKCSATSLWRGCDRNAVPATPFDGTFTLRQESVPVVATRGAGTSGLTRTPVPDPSGVMYMNIVVCVKQIPDPAMPGQLDPGSKTLKREGKLIMDESDSFGVEMGLQLAEKAGGGEVTVVSMVPSAGLQGMRSALAMGAAKAVLVSDDSLTGTDALGTAKVLAAAVKRIGEVDLVLTATESTDGYTGTVPAQLGELLGWPSLTFARAIE